MAVPTNLPGKTETIHVALARVHGVVRIALRHLVEREFEMAVGETASGEAVRGAPSSVAPNVLIVDGELPVWSEETATREEGDRDLGAHVLAISPDVGESSVATTVEAGVAAYLSTREDATTIMEAVRSLVEGERGSFSRRVADALLRYRAKDSVGLDTLTGRERDVLRLLAKGYSNRTIGDEVHLSKAAVKKHISSIYGKLDIRRQESDPKFTHPRVMAAVKAQRNGLI